MLSVIFFAISFIYSFFYIKLICANKKIDACETNSNFCVHAGSRVIVIAIIVLFAFPVIDFSFNYGMGDLLRDMSVINGLIWYSLHLIGLFAAHTRLEVNEDNFTRRTIFSSTTYAFKDTYITSSRISSMVLRSHASYYIVTDILGNRLFSINNDWHNAKLFYDRFDPKHREVYSNHFNKTQLNKKQ